MTIRSIQHAERSTNSGRRVMEIFLDFTLYLTIFMV
jgi:hypothetical protein